MKKEDINYIFIDLDGTLIKTKSGRTFPKDTDDWMIREEVWIALSKLSREGHLFNIHIISNQGGIEKGFVKEHGFVKKISSIANMLHQQTEVPVTYDYCISNDKDDLNRKPNPGMIWDFIDEAFVSDNIRIRDDQCLMIGDASGKEGQFSDSDKKCAENANVVYMDVDDFVSWINKIK